MSDLEIVFSLGQVVGTVGTLVWLTRSLKNELRETNQRIEDFQRTVEQRILELEKELRYEISEKVDKRQYYDDVGGWRSEIRELRQFFFESILSAVKELLKELRK
ncbi:MAG: hypothetical protein ABGX12_05325 [Desulfurobacteriaceae bacterium]